MNHSPILIEKDERKCKGETRAKSMFVNPERALRELLTWLGKSPVRICDWSPPGMLCTRLTYGAENYILVATEKGVDVEESLSPCCHFLCFCYCNADVQCGLEKSYTLYLEMESPQHLPPHSARDSHHSLPHLDMVRGRGRTVGEFTGTYKGNTTGTFEATVPPLVCVASLWAIMDHFTN